MSTAPPLTFGTDGSCLRNPDGPTGWAYICQDGRYAIGGCARGTNQIGELMAVLSVLRDFPRGALELQSDSAYAIGCSATWKAGWQRAGYRRKTGPIANLAIIREIHRLLDGRGDPVHFVKVKAHLADPSVHPLNVRADELAGRGARAAQLTRADVAERGTWGPATDALPVPSATPTDRSPAALPADPKAQDTVLDTVQDTGQDTGGFLF